MADNNRYSNYIQPVVMMADPDLPDSFPAATTDEVTSATATITTPHHEIHEGEMFRAFVVNLALADDAKLGILLDTTGAVKYGHLSYDPACGGDFEFRLRRNATVTLAGGALAEINVHDASGNVAQIEATSNPTVTDATGVELDHFVGPGGTGGNAAGSKSSRSEEKAVMRTGGSTYYLEMFNRSGGAKVASITALWYEESTKGG